MSWGAVGGAVAGFALNQLTADDGDSNQSQIQTQTVQKYTPEQLAMLQSASTIAKNRLAANPDYKFNLGPYRSYLEKYGATSEDKINQLYKGVRAPFTGKLVNQLYSDAIVPEFEASTLPKLRAEYAGPGYWGSARARGVSDAYASLDRQRASDYVGAEQTRLNQDYETNQARIQAIIAALSQQPANMTQAAAISQMQQTPQLSPYWQAVISLLGNDGQDTIASATQPQAGFMDYLGQGAGTAIGSQLPALLSQLFSSETPAGGN